MPPSPFGSGQYGGQQMGQLPSQGLSAPNNIFAEPSVPQSPFAASNPPFGSLTPMQRQLPSHSLGGQLPSGAFQQPGTGFSQMPIQMPNGAVQQYGTNSLQQPPTSFPSIPSPSPGVGGAFSQQSANGFHHSAGGFPPMTSQSLNGGFQGSYQPGSMNGFSSAGLSNGLEPVRKSNRRFWLIGGIIALVVILIAVSVGGYEIVLKPSGAANVPTPTFTPAPTPTGTPLYSDQFTNNNHGWDLTSSSGQFSVKVGNGAMTLEDDNNRLLWEIVPGGRNFSNFYLTVDAVLSKGTEANGYGIYIRGASNQSLDIATYYRFELYGDGTYAIFKGTVDASGTSNSIALVDYTMSPVIQKQGQVNHIAINANGSTLSFYVNGHLIKFVSDNTYASGSIAMFVSNLPNSPPGAQAKFSHLIIYPAQS
jgi:hypothetical protein